jgi:hypothetical protein
MCGRKSLVIGNGMHAAYNNITGNQGFGVLSFKQRDFALGASIALHGMARRLTVIIRE